jgi:hypothetical protein
MSCIDIGFFFSQMGAGVWGDIAFDYRADYNANSVVNQLDIHSLHHPWSADVDPKWF